MSFIVVPSVAPVQAISCVKATAADTIIRTMTEMVALPNSDLERTSQLRRRFAAASASVANPQQNDANHRKHNDAQRQDVDGRG